jgi:hypothetical protein
MLVSAMTATRSFTSRAVRLGPTRPAYFAPKLVERLQREFELTTIGTAGDDVALMMAGN